MARSDLSLPFTPASQHPCGRVSSASIGLILALGVLFACFSSSASAQSGGARGIQLPPNPTDAAMTGNYYALVIGIDEYHPPLPKLKTAANDAAAIGKLLEDRYGFQVKRLLNKDATRSSVLDALVDYRNTLNDKDNLLIYYAGHGFSDHEAQKAYWLPVDAESPTSPNRISADDLTTAVRVLPARHVLIVSDSCYSGGLSRGVDEPGQSGGRPAFLKRMLNSRSRTLMASGGDEPVADGGTDGHSVFAFAILRALERADEAMFTASDLFYNSIRQQVAGMSDQLPQYTFIQNSGHDEGDFIFMRRGAATPVLPDATENASGPHEALPPVPPVLAAKWIPGEGAGKDGAAYSEQLYPFAISLLRGTCESGIAVACTHLGVMYHHGTGVARDEAQAAALYRKGCDGGEAAGCANLGWMVGNGIGVAKDEAQAVSLYRKGCEGGEAAGCTDLGWMTGNGAGIKKDEAQAVTLYRKGCDSGEPAGCTDLGWMYANGRGIGKDNLQAAAFYLKGCNGGELKGCVNLGAIYESGDGVGKDSAQAASYYQKACDGGDQDGCRALKRLKP
jgi:TPR repeat protein